MSELIVVVTLHELLNVEQVFLVPLLPRGLFEVSGLLEHLHWEVICVRGDFQAVQWCLCEIQSLLLQNHFLELQVRNLLFPFVEDLFFGLLTLDGFFHLAHHLLESRSEPLQFLLFLLESGLQIGLFGVRSVG